jgi:hypothetical protein
VPGFDKKQHLSNEPEASLLLMATITGALQTDFKGNPEMAQSINPFFWWAGETPRISAIWNF